MKTLLVKKLNLSRTDNYDDIDNGHYKCDSWIYFRPRKNT